MTYIPLHHKYRPQTFAQLVGQEAIATTLSNALTQNRIAPAYLFTGARGTGKTSSARIFAKSLNCIGGDRPTPQPCGVCDVCKEITRGGALDVIEIDAASNTGVDSIRELIERSQFAPVRCRYKVYIIDECLTGDSLVMTDAGLMRIDDPDLQGKKALSYNDDTQQWEFKPILRWLDQGVRQTIILKTGSREIRCTGNHLIRTDTGWIPARNVKEGMKILSPAPVIAGNLSMNMAQTDAFAAMPEVINSKGTPMVPNPTIAPSLSNKQNHYGHTVSVAVENDLPSLLSSNKKEKAYSPFNTIGLNIPISKGMGYGINELKTFYQHQKQLMKHIWDWSMERCWAMPRSVIPTLTVAFPDSPGPTVLNSFAGSNTKQNGCQPFVLSYEQSKMQAMENTLPWLTLNAIQTLLPSLPWSNPQAIVKLSLVNGWMPSPLKAWLGGTWMMGLSASAVGGLQSYNCIPKDFPTTSKRSWLNGYWNKAIKREFSPTIENQLGSNTVFSFSTQTHPDNGLLTSNPTQSQKWTTSFEIVEAIESSVFENVYDIEVEDNHNFVANGLLVHNCHMLTSAAFNALLKTLEEPPDRVIFVLATTDPQRVLPTIISRCQRFDFRRIPLDSLVQHLGYISKQESIAIVPEALHLVGQISQGGLRDAESLLDQLSLSAEEVSVEKVWDLVGAVPERDLMALVEAIAADDAEATIDLTRKLMDRGREPLIVLQNLASFYRDLLIAKTAPQRNDLAAITPPTWATMTAFVKAASLSWLLHGQQHLRSAELQIKNTTQPRLWLEITLMGLLPSAMGDHRSETIAVPSRAPAAVRAAHPAPPPQSEPPKSPPPIATPSLPTPSLPNSPPIPDSPPDLTKLWQEILSNIEEIPARAILNANCHIAELNGKEIKIGVFQKSSLAIVKARSAQLGKACAKTLKGSVKVSLIVTEGKGPEGKAPEVQPMTLVAPPHPTAPQAPKPATPKPTPQSSPATTLVAENPIASYEVPSTKSWEVDDLTRATRSLADAFNGKIVSLDDDIVIEEPIDASNATIDLMPNIADIMGSDALEENDRDDDDGDDTPF